MPGLREQPVYNDKQRCGRVPVEVKRPEYDGRNDDEIMEEQNSPVTQAQKHDARKTKDLIKKVRPGEALPAHHQAPEKEKRC